MPKPTDHDSYIAGAPEFARPILEKFRKAVHEGCPVVEESIKWSAPHFDHHGILAGMAAYKAHASVWFGRGMEMDDPEGLLTIIGKTGMGSIRVERASDLPSQAVLVKYVREAAKRNEAAASAPRKKAAKKTAAKPAAKKVEAPDDLMQALKRSKEALATFEGFAPGYRKDYVLWVTEAKREATRAKRIAQAVEWMAEGKPRNWKYMPEWR